MSGAEGSKENVLSEMEVGMIGLRELHSHYQFSNTPPDEEPPTRSLSYERKAGEKGEVPFDEIERFLRIKAGYAGGSSGPRYAGQSREGTTPGLNGFIICFLQEIRKIVCRKKALGHATTGAIAGLTAWIAEQFSLGFHGAAAISAAIVIAVSSAAKSTFCKMTAAEVDKALSGSMSIKPRHRPART
jgi:hypothetical protein